MAQASLDNPEAPAPCGCRTDRTVARWRSTRFSVPQNVADPFDTVEWDLRTAAIKGEAGEVLFEQTDCEIPSDLEPVGHQRRRAASISMARSTRPKRETSVRQLIHRVSRTIADWGMQGRLFRLGRPTASGSIAS